MYPLIAGGMQGKGCICYVEDEDDVDRQTSEHGD